MKILLPALESGSSKDIYENYFASFRIRIPQRHLISDILVTSVSKLVLVENLSYENEFDLHENEPVGEIYFHIHERFHTKTFILTQGNSEMTYCNCVGTHMHVVIYLSILQGLNLLKSPKNVKKVAPEVL